MKKYWFISYFTWHLAPRPNVWSPCSGIIDVHPMLWMRSQPKDTTVMWWKQLDEEEAKLFEESQHIPHVPAPSNG